MIDISAEQVVSLTAATGHLPARRAGKKPNVSTLYRWAQTGVRGTRLETIMIGGTRCTSLEALQRFFDGITAASEPQASPPLAPRFASLRQQQVEAAEQRLARAGRHPNIN